MRIVVIGGGAAGFFAAISAAEHHARAEVILLERTDKLLAKVRVSGGGRCNVTHDCPEPRKLAKFYPRGGTFLKKAFQQWSMPDTVAWFRSRGVELKTEADGRMFPVTDDSDTIAQALLGAARERGVEVRLREVVQALVRTPNGWSVQCGEALQADHVIVATGGSPKRQGLQWLAELGHAIVDPVPSLFTFNLPGDPITRLMGTVAMARVRVEGTDLESTGPLLVTHWGFSGPAVLKLSAWGARQLASTNYRFGVRVNWCGGRNEDEVREALLTEAREHPKRSTGNLRSLDTTARLWEYLLERAGVEAARPLGELGRDRTNRLVAVLTNDRYQAQGKTTFKEEFVTAGGVDLMEVDPGTLASRRHPGLFFAGEVLDIDGITGGFNFQAAWTTGRIAGRCGATATDRTTS